MGFTYMRGERGQRDNWPFQYVGAELAVRARAKAEPMQGQRGRCLGFLNHGAPPLESPGVRRRTEGAYSLHYVALQFVAYGPGGCKALVGRHPPAGRHRSSADRCPRVIPKRGIGSREAHAPNKN